MSKEAKNIFLIILSALLSSLAVKGFVEPANLYPAGFLGVAVYLANLGNTYLHLSFSYNIIFLFLNIFSTFLVLKVAGKKLILYSILQYLLVSIFIAILPSFQLVKDVMLLSIFGGVLAGISCWLALQANASSGGTDFIAIFFSTKFQRSSWTEVMIFNSIILILAGFSFGFENSFYSIIYQFIVTFIINHLHTRYQLFSLHIITSKPKEVSELILQITNHGLTEIKAKGVFSGDQKTILFMICNQFEVENITLQVQIIDPNVFISEAKAYHVVGYYLQERLS